MRLYFVFIGLLLLSAKLSGQCGVDRWNVKTCSDTGWIDTVPFKSNIVVLSSVKPPRWGRKLARTGYEHTVVCKITKYIWL